MMLLRVCVWSRKSPDAPTPLPAAAARCATGSRRLRGRSNVRPSSVRGHVRFGRTLDVGVGIDWAMGSIRGIQINRSALELELDVGVIPTVWHWNPAEVGIGHWALALEIDIQAPTTFDIDATTTEVRVFRYATRKQAQTLSLFRVLFFRWVDTQLPSRGNSGVSRLTGTLACPWICTKRLKFSKCRCQAAS